MLQFGDIVSASHNSMPGEWRFDIMIETKTFYSVASLLDLEGRKLSVTGRKPARKQTEKKAPKNATDRTLLPTVTKGKKVETCCRVKGSCTS